MVTNIPNCIMMKEFIVVLHIIIITYGQFWSAWCPIWSIMVHPAVGSSEAAAHNLGSLHLEVQLEVQSKVKLEVQFEVEFKSSPE